MKRNSSVPKNRAKRNTAPASKERISFIDDELHRATTEAMRDLVAESKILTAMLEAIVAAVRFYGSDAPEWFEDAINRPMLADAGRRLSDQIRAESELEKMIRLAREVR